MTDFLPGSDVNSFSKTSKSAKFQESANGFRVIVTHVLTVYMKQLNLREANHGFSRLVREMSGRVHVCGSQERQARRGNRRLRRKACCPHADYGTRARVSRVSEVGAQGAMTPRVSAAGRATSCMSAERFRLDTNILMCAVDAREGCEIAQH